MKKIIKIILYLFLFCICFMGFVFLINTPFFDEKLNPQITNLLEKQTANIPDQQNAFYYVWGFSAEKDKDPHEAGFLYVKSINEELKKDPFAEHLYDLHGHYFGKTIGVEHSDFIRSEMCDMPRKNNCIEKIEDQYNQVLAAVSDNSILLERYRKLIEYPHFNVTMIRTVQTPIPSYYDILLLQKLYLHNQYLIHKEHPTDIVQAIKKDLNFWHMIVKEGTNTIDVVVARILISRDISFLSDLIANNVMTINEVLLIKQTLEDININETDISEIYLKNVIVSATEISSLVTNEEILPLLGYSKFEVVLYRMFLQPRATQNILYSLYNEIMRITNLSGAEFAQYKKTSDQQNNKPEWAKPGIHFIYNPGGKIYSHPEPMKFIVRHIARKHDLVGFINLVGLQLELLVNDTDPEALVAKSKYRNPYTNGPMQLDSQNRTISFKCLFPDRLDCQTSF